jgi:hypothetical protein
MELGLHTSMASTNMLHIYRPGREGRGRRATQGCGLRLRLPGERDRAVPHAEGGRHHGPLCRPGHPAFPGTTRSPLCDVLVFMAVVSVLVWCLDSFHPNPCPPVPPQMHAAGITKTKMFALCFRHGGGVVTLGGVDTRLHSRARTPGPNTAAGNRTSNGGVLFAALLKPKGWYTVRLLDVLMRSSDGAGDNLLSEAKSIGGDPSKYAAGKGTIVDSGTTDTYLPSAVRGQFQALFRSLTGKEYSNKQAYYTKEQFSKLPTVVFRLQAAGQAGTVDLEVAPSSYMEFQKEAGGGGAAGGAGRYTPRIYLTEATGAVLGANAINEHNVIFDPDNLRVGFAKSRCSYERQHSRHDFASSTSAPVAVAQQPVAPQPPPPSPAKPAPPSKAGSGAAIKNAVKPVTVSRPKPGPAPVKPVPAADGNIWDSVDTESTSAAPPAVTSPGTGRIPSLSAAKVPLTGQQQDALDTMLQEAAYMFVTSRVLPCKPTLTIPCSARCDHSAHTAPVEETESPAGTCQCLVCSTTSLLFNYSCVVRAGAMLDFIRLSSGGEVSVGSARVERGQQYWRVPQCTGSSSRRLTSASAAALEGLHHLRGLQEASALEIAIGADELGLSADWALLPKQATPPVRTVLEECAVSCPVAEEDPLSRVAVAAQPVRVSNGLALESSASPCDPVTHTRTQLHVEEGRTVDLPADKSSVLVLQGGDRSVCVVVENAHSVTSNAADLSGLEHSAQCQVVSVVSAPCKPYRLNCTSTARMRDGARADFDAVRVDASDIVFTLHLRLKGLRGGQLTALQTDDLVNAFAQIFQVGRRRSVWLTEC